MFRSILCPVDFSIHSRRALQYGAALATRFGGQVHVLSVSDPLLVAAARASSRGRESVSDLSRAELARFVANTLRGGPADARRITQTVVVGDASTEILRVAKRLRSDLIVMGTEGLSGVPRFVFGSTTAAVLRRSNIPVLTVRGGRRRRLGSSSKRGR